MTLELLTVVITSFRRVDYVERAYRSVKKCGIENVVISSSGLNDPIYHKLIELQKEDPNLKLALSTKDSGCNEQWLQGVYQVTTPYVQILHDDDLLNIEQYPDLVLRALADLDMDRCDFCLWDGSSEGEGMLPGVVPSLPSWEEGIHDTSRLMGELLRANRLAISPVVAIFPRDLVIRTLKECAQNFTGGEFFTRPGMMVGNDMMLYLRAAEKYQKVAYYRSAGTIYWNHGGSETVSQMSSGGRALIGAYNATQAYFKRVRGESIVLSPRVIHVFNDYHTEGPSLSRKNTAFQTWTYQYENEGAICCPVKTESLGRSSDCKRELPYIKDLIEEGFARAQPEDFVVITNADIRVAQQFSSVVRNLKVDSFYSHRRDFTGIGIIADSQISAGAEYIGIDLFGFKKAWWDANKDYYPDMLLGCEAWDYILKILIDLTRGIVIPNQIYHEKHVSHWENPEFRFVDPGQIHNRTLAKSWLIRRNGYDGEFDLGVKHVDILSKKSFVSQGQTFKAKEQQRIVRHFNTMPAAPSSLPPILLAIQYWEDDREKAEQLIKLVTDLQDDPTDAAELVIVARHDTYINPDIVQYASNKFRVWTLMCKKCPPFHPAAPNSMWLQTMQFCSRLFHTKKTRATSVLTFEADCAPASKDWYLQIQKEFQEVRKQGKLLMGHVYPGDAITRKHVNGNAVFDIEILRKLPWIQPIHPKHAWDLVYAAGWENVWADTSLIFNDYRKPTITEGELFGSRRPGMAPPVLTHGIRDNSGLELSRKKLLSTP